MPGLLRIDVSMCTRDFPSTEELARVFERSGSWSMSKKGDEYYLALNPSLKDGPECIARFKQGCEEVTIYCGKRTLRKGRGKSGEKSLRLSSGPAHLDVRPCVERRYHCACCRRGDEREGICFPRTLWHGKEHVGKAVQ
jgi:hypothetical protein